MSSDSSQLFQSSDIAEFYLKYRPTYGPEVYNTIINFCKEKTSSELELAIDLGCGSGQSTLPLTKIFKQVIGVDISKEQVSRAPTHLPNLTFRVGAADEQLSLVDKDSADLVTVAQAMHWMNAGLYPEVERVLKPGGAFVVYGYGLPELDEPKANEIILQFHDDVLGPYWANGRNKIRERYASYSLPFPGWRRNDSLTIERSWTLDEFIGYLCSWSAFQTFLMTNPTNDAMPVLRQKLQEVYQKDHALGKELPVKVTWPVFMLMGHKPHH